LISSETLADVFNLAANGEVAASLEASASALNCARFSDASAALRKRKAAAAASEPWCQMAWLLPSGR
jgi:hypothetical protein